MWLQQKKRYIPVMPDPTKPNALTAALDPQVTRQEGEGASQLLERVDNRYSSLPVSYPSSRLRLHHLLTSCLISRRKLLEVIKDDE